MSPPPFPAVAVAASTGGPNVLLDLFRGLEASLPAAVFVVQHGPEWMMPVLAARLAKESGLRAEVAEGGRAAEAGAVFLAPGDRHLTVVPGTLALEVLDAPKENFVRPAADPLLRSVAAAFGRYGIAVVLTGMGRDGAEGSRAVADAGGLVLVQDPAPAVAPSMPRQAAEACPDARVVAVADLPSAIAAAVASLADALGTRP